ncbi:MAG: hypothetical protein B7Z08_09245 [Sphingomonadales bacterium 32-68-7]|nr:MAG: hypothetical protein B7Z08_09245 [Sphingomonadales bacterium 32-68-7]
MTAPDYRRDGYALVKGLIPREVATMMLVQLQSDLASRGMSLANLEREGPLLARAASEIAGNQYPKFAFFHWGLTSRVEELVGVPLLPSYCYFRLYREGDICKVHGDRLACEHSLSLTLDYSDGVPWPLEVAREPIAAPYQRADLAFAPEERSGSVSMEPGDAVLYQGVHHHHGRTAPNPNAWSAHLFLHWVARGGPYADQAFDGRPPPPPVRF